MSIAAMYLKMSGVTGESLADGHIGDIDLVGWNWGMVAAYDTRTHLAAGASAYNNLSIVKRVDRATPTLFSYLDNHTPVDSVTLTVAKSSGGAALEYFTIELTGVRIVTVDVRSDDAELLENVSLNFATVSVNYVPQSTLGTQASGAVSFQSTRNAPEPDPYNR
jgi:type VI secretion system secreted protein Hcp